MISKKAGKLGLVNVTVSFASLFVDHAGWTPLHEACNHGSTECVQALLQYCPNLQLGSQVQGVSPLHDALLSQHTHIAKMLLRRGGECPTYCTRIQSEIKSSHNNAYKHTYIHTQCMKIHTVNTDLHIRGLKT